MRYATEQESPSSVVPVAENPTCLSEPQSGDTACSIPSEIMFMSNWNQIRVRRLPLLLVGVRIIRKTKMQQCGKNNLLNRLASHNQLGLNGTESMNN